MNPDILHLVHERGVSEVLHFTTNHGLIGILATSQLSCRDQLDEDKYLENIKLANCTVRKDPEWTGYVNMSISVVNNEMLGTSQNWHRTGDVWWAVLSFTADILADDGVWFTTTNNTHTQTVRRGQGLEGLKNLYSEPIPWGHYGSKSWRRGLPADRPTNPQAEVLYPGAVPLTKLQAIYVPQEEHLDQIEGWIAALHAARPVTVACRPEVFQ
ncbi:DUF4433 domain-containing protein [Nocardia sp. SYP-A9097]|uniref:DarT ssDNA thymidine ADP-ribosyltransferase family protein n=1 Tax=Nocardia sp. SYP-A9097 TaxID=2663237 RepID=UPI00129A9297|nr:DarT ssDNA thymidine ADP-ribosyltransferase family protein [Nocardia sp. SYP-A9097]MRH92781.1 DUF4433 domain-containing protein [Nocardia sp. SYP-A9097]